MQEEAESLASYYLLAIQWNVFLGTIIFVHYMAMQHGNERIIFHVLYFRSC